MRTNRSVHAGRVAGWIVGVGLMLPLAGCGARQGMFAPGPAESGRLAVSLERYEARQVWSGCRSDGSRAQRAAASREGSPVHAKRAGRADLAEPISSGGLSMHPGRLAASDGWTAGRSAIADAGSCPQAGSVGPAYLTLASLDPSDEPAAPSTQQGEPSPRDPLPSLRETVVRDLKRLPEGLWQDTKRVYTDPTNVVVLLTAGGAALALRPEVDDDIEDKYDRSHSFSEPWRDTFGVLGNPGTHFALAGAWYLLGAEKRDAKTYQVGRTLMNALIINDLSTLLLKVACNTESPNGENLAFPSGHVSSTACLAAVMHEAYGPWVGIPLYGLTGLVAVERMDDREHAFSDVVFGAALGWVIGHTVATGHRPEIFGGQIVPYADPVNRSSGLAWIKSF